MRNARFALVVAAVTALLAVGAAVARYRQAASTPEEGDE